MNKQEIDQLLSAQKNFFHTGETKPIAFRKNQLKKLRLVLQQAEAEISKALFDDLHKSAFEAYSTEIGFVLEELRFHLRHLRKWMKQKRVSNPLTNYPASARLHYEPKGTVLIIAPWNYPVQLLIAPLIGAISAGNTVILKPSELALHTAVVMEKLINACFEKEYVHVVNGGIETSKHLLSMEFDHIFFTGSTYVGRIVAQEAAKKLIPVTLELGGKSPCIVDKDANIDVAAKRIAWGKTINAGQTCIAPDYLFAHKSVKDKLVKKIAENIKEMYGDDIRQSRFYPRIVNEKAMERLIYLMEQGKIVAGGEFNKEEKFIAPTIIDEITPESRIMEEEIFGPLLPVMTFDHIDETTDYINNHEKPLAFYYFGKDKGAKEILRKTSSGGACINDTILHIANHHLPFGGVGNSGMGIYHSHGSFLAFSNQRSVVSSPTWIDLPLKYVPFKYFKLIRKII